VTAAQFCASAVAHPQILVETEIGSATWPSEKLKLRLHICNSPTRFLYKQSHDTAQVLRRSVSSLGCLKAINFEIDKFTQSMFEVISKKTRNHWRSR
jgi:hypothetical protein